MDDIIEVVPAIYNDHRPDPHTGITIIPWTLATIPETPHWHNELEVCCCLEGSGVFYFKNKQYDIGPGDIMVVSHIERHTSKSLCGSPCSNLFLFFSASTLEKLDVQLLRPFLYDREQFVHKIPAHQPIAGEICSLMKRMREETEARRPAYEPLAKSMLLQICSLLLRHYDAQTAMAWRRIHQKYEAVREGIAYMKEYYQEPIRLEDVARAMALSPSRARHLFVEMVGERFKTYLLNLRVQAAQRLLVQTGIPVEAIAEKCGFQSASSFYRDFKQMVGETPLSYRQRHTHRE